MNTNHVLSALLAGTSTLALSTGAYAQAARAATADAAAVVQEVVVTGSRVIQNGNNSPTPLTVVSTDTLLTTQPTTISDGLIQLPQFLNSQSQSSNPGPSANNASASYLNLRALGTTRTLILYDGHRQPSTAGNGSVDTNLIPQLLIQRVDVVTGGASAVYGSDAVAGVVNFVTDHAFNGIKASLRAGVSQYGDDKTFDGSIAFGKSFMGGRLHLEGSYEYLDDPGILLFGKLSRPWGRKVMGQAGTGTAANPYQTFEQERLSNTSFGGVFTSGALNGYEFNTNNVATPFKHGIATGTAGIEIGGDGGYYDTASLKGALHEHQYFGRADYDVTDKIHGYAQMAYTKVQDENYHQNNEVRGSSNFGVIGLANAFLKNIVLPTGVTNPYNANCTANTTACTLQYGKIIELAPTLNPETHENMLMGMFGLDGSIGDYKWDLGYEKTYSVQNTRNNSNLHSGRLTAAEDAVFAPNGTIVCHAALVNPAYANCVPLNLFGPTSESAAAIKYILQTTNYWARTRMDDFNGSITGAPISTWAGPVNMALSAEYRKQRFNQLSDALPSDHPDCVGIQYNCTATTALWITNVGANRALVSQAVKEVAYEAVVPLLKDLAFAQSFNVQLAARYTKYDNQNGSVATSFTAKTWKIGPEWHINDDILVRATKSRDIRAPNLNELFAPQTFSPNGYVDLHTGNIQQQVPVYSQGNSALTPEIADTTSAGVVYKPSFIPRASISVDWYDISLSNAISNVSGQGLPVQTLCEDSGGTSVYCTLYNRPLPFSNHTAANFPLGVYSQSLNIASIKTHGVDVEANYATDIFGHATQMRVLGSFQPHIVNNAGPAGITDTGGTAGIPSKKIAAFLNIQITDALRTQIQTNWRGSLHRYNTPTLIYAQGDLPAVAYTAVNLTYDIKNELGSTQVYVNVKNVFNQQPVGPYAGGGAQTVPGLFGGFVPGDDNIGRYYTVGVRIRR